MSPMTALEILHRGVFTTVQDAGRPGLAYFAVPRSGPVDPGLARRANSLVGNPAHAAVLEFNLMGATLRFTTPAIIALTGADLRWRLDGASIAREQRHELPAGAVLQGAYTADGARGYLAVAGELVREPELGSVAMHAQIHGRLAVGERLVFAQGGVGSRVEPRAAIPDVEGVPLGDLPSFGLELLPGPEWDALTEDSRHRLLNARWSVSPQSDRVGTRLAGPALALRTDVRFESVPVWVNCVQVDPSGTAIVVGVDGGVLGGYPRVATLIGTRA